MDLDWRPSDAGVFSKRNITRNRSTQHINLMGKEFNPIVIFLVVYAAMLANSFWEAYVEGRNPWDKRKIGWKIHLSEKYTFPAYHFYLFVVMWPLLLSLPLIIYGWNTKLFGILLSAYTSGLVLEDFMWFVVNPNVKLSEFNSKFANYYPWIKSGKFEIPAGYIILVILSFASWWFLWR
ncbi:MAG: hypothetical protein UT19_C0013G0010 [Candidatus Woesebacteria bacterium GW2011_GWB1_39_10b]|uniref:Uncharacterized protein n=3 Tax=Candidatus Woeseibacteriota TaxID=1752722 RepID=A0A0G0NGV3_9BACT|nr:MAG: hypothetical protein US72_C0004G0056 [Microgenomates group bacterium GW2011_GWC1_38_12]KKQ93346.1 MAG: hypothetical protein UT19_C0013G0010 [Candidatus Woesebacteria bacterium GW2011_GWB1_39_10b]KKR12056.1 MAG: hypothetical protein UT40_C0029G0008 [Candidatus Woesebacteria bacterium GW2011_GWA1_39_21b]